MQRYRASTVIAAEPQRVFDYMADFTRHPEWAGDDLTVEPVNGGPTSLGSRFRSTGKQMGLRRDEIAVTRSSRPGASSSNREATKGSSTTGSSWRGSRVGRG